MECPHCGCWAPDDPETGYSGPELCPSCQQAGWVETAQGELLNEHEEPIVEPEGARR